MCAKVCKNCPFLSSPNAFCYDADAMEALEEGEIPACHAEVGTESIFAHAPFEPANPCVGHQRWMEGDLGFKKPKLAPAATALLSEEA